MLESQNPEARAMPDAWGSFPPASVLSPRTEGPGGAAYPGVGVAGGA